MQKQKISASQHLTYDDAVSYLEALLASFRERKIVVENGMEHVVLTPPDNVSIEVEAKVKKEKQKFSLELSWTGIPEAQAPELKISPEEPEAIQVATPDSAEEIPAACDATAAKGEPTAGKENEPATATEAKKEEYKSGSKPKDDMETKETTDTKGTKEAKEDKKSGAKADKAADKKADSAKGKGEK